MMRFEVHQDTGGKSRWRLVASNGRSVATSGEAFASEGNARRAAQAFKSMARSEDFEVYVDAGGAYRWRAKARNGHTVAASGVAFASQRNAREAAGNVQANAGAAAGP